MKKVQQLKGGFGGATTEELHYLQTELLNLMLEFDELCKRHGIQYYLDGGSVIGALRHRGFVPWDDDIDILMKHDEFEKLLSIIDDELAAKPTRLLSFMGRESEHHRTFARYVRTDVPHILRSTLVEATYEPGIFIDIFILDSAPSAALEKYTDYIEEAEDWYHKRVPGIVGGMSLPKYRLMRTLEAVFGQTWVEKHYVKGFTRWKNEPADYWIPRNGYNYAVYEGDVFGEPIYLPFEGHMLPVPTKPEKYLRGHYGPQWYMMPPPADRDFTHYTFTSTTHTTQELMAGYEGIREGDLVRKHKEAEHINRVKRHKHFKKRSQVLSEIRADVLTRESTDLDEREFATLDADDRFGEIIELFAPTMVRVQALARQSKGKLPKVDIASSIIRTVLRAYASIGQFGPALTLCNIVSATAEERDFLDQVIELDRRIQDGEHELAAALASEIIATNPRCIPAWEAEYQLRPNEYSSQQIVDLSNDLATRVPSVIALKPYLARALRSEGDESAATAQYREVLARSENGLHVLEANEYLGSVEQENTESTPVSPSTDAYTPDAAQQVQLNLLAEIQQICEAKGIRYSLVGPAAIDYLRNGGLTVAYYDITIAMTPKNYDSFIEAVQQELPQHRSVEGWFNNPFFPYKEIWYSDTETLHFRPRKSRTQSASIRVKIVPFKPGLRGNSVTRWQDTKANKYIERFKPFASRRPKLARTLMYPMFALQKEMRRRDWSRYHNVSNMKNVGFFYHSGYVNTLFGLRDTMINQTEVIDLNGAPVQMAKELLQNPRRVVPGFDQVELKPFNDSAAVVSAAVSYDQLLESIPQREITAAYRAEAKQLSALNGTKKYQKQWYAYENYIERTALHLHKMKLREQYEGKSVEIAALAQNEQFDELSEQLEDYAALFMYFYNKSMLLVVDDQLFTALMVLLRHRGQPNVAAKAEQWYRETEERP